VLGLAPEQALRAQVAGVPFPTWHGELLLQAGRARLSGAQDQVTSLVFEEGFDTRTHTRTGLLIGSVVGVAATTVFLVGFCGDPDTACQADEIGRAVVLIALPCAAAGALIGWLVRTER
jgi:hypothetical protein